MESEIKPTLYVKNIDNTYSVYEENKNVFLSASNPDAWISGEGEVSSNQVVVEYWKIAGKKIDPLYNFSSLLSIFNEDLRAIRHGVKNNKPVMHVIDELIKKTIK